MVLWIMGLSDDTKMQIQGYFNDPSGFMKNMPRTKNMISLPGATKLTQKRAQKDPENEKGDAAGLGVGELNEQEGFQVSKEIKEQLKKESGLKQISRYVDIRLTKEGIQIELLENTGGVFFSSGSAVISPLGKSLIQKIVPTLIETGRFIVIEGHTDRKPYAGTQFTNWELSTNRAISLRQMLANFGVPTAQFREVRGCADQRLKFPQQPYDAKNRRVTMLLPWGARAIRPKGKVEAKRSLKAELTPKFNIHAEKLSPVSTKSSH